MENKNNKNEGNFMNVCKKLRKQQQKYLCKHSKKKKRKEVNAYNLPRRN